MPMSIVLKNFLKNSSYATIAQLISLLTSAALSLVLPKFVSIDTYGYWQYFLLYSGYVGLLHFGFNDGVYLKLGGKKFQQISKEVYLPQFVIVFFAQLMFAIILASLSLFFVHDPLKQDIFLLLSLYIIVENSYKILGFTLMATDKIIFYSKSVILDKLAFLFFVIIVFAGIFEVDAIQIIYFYLTSRLLALLYVFLVYKEFFYKWYEHSYRGCFSKVKENSLFGVLLTISNILGTLIVGSGRIMVEYFWDIDTFAKISFALSLSMFILIFISQIGLVLFPVLRNIKRTVQKILLEKAIFILGIFVICLFFLFFPLYFFVELWLPAYSESLNYLVYLFPISLYETKFILLFTTYFKTLNKQKILFRINVCALLFSLVLYVISVYFMSLEMLVFSIFLAIALRSILSQIYLLKNYNLKIKPLLYIEFLLAIMFVTVFTLFGISYLFSFFVLALGSLMFFYKNRLKSEFSFMYTKIKNK